MNNIVVIGNLGRDPELKFTSNQNATVKFSIADTRDYNGKKETTWHRCVAWGKTAENIASSFSKGDRVIVTGRYKSDEYTDKNGVKKNTMELWVDDCGHSIRFDLPKGSTNYRPQATLPSQYDGEEEPF